MRRMNSGFVDRGVCVCVNDKSEGRSRRNGERGVTGTPTGLAAKGLLAEAAGGVVACVKMRYGK